jgi:hypothetical protein
MLQSEAWRKPGPEWVGAGCIAHGAALATKDFHKLLKSQGHHSTKWGVRWLNMSINNDANMLANFGSDSPAAKALLRCLQRVVYGDTRAIAVSVSTRFATNFFTMQGIQRNKAALLQACSNNAWTDLSGKLVVPLLSPEHTAAYLLNPLYCSVRGGVANTP